MAKPMFTRVGTLACETLNGYQLAYNARGRSWTYSPTAGVRPSSTDFPKLKIGTRPGTPTPPDYFGCTIHEDGVPISTVDKRTRSGSIYHTNLGWLSPADLRNSR